MSITNIIPTSGNIFVNTNSNTKVILLPSANDSIGKTFTIKDFTGNARQYPFFVSTTSALDRIDRTTSSIQLSNSSDMIKIQSFGSNLWTLLGLETDFLPIKFNTLYPGESDNVGSGRFYVNPTNVPSISATGGSIINATIENFSGKWRPVTDQSILFYSTLVGGGIVSSNSSNLFSTTTFTTDGSTNITNPLTFNTSYYLVVQTSNSSNLSYSSNAVRAGPYLFGAIAVAPSNVTVNALVNPITIFWSTPTTSLSMPVSSISIQVLFSLQNDWSSASQVSSIVTGIGSGISSITFGTPTTPYFYGARVYSVNGLGSNFSSNISLAPSILSPLAPVNPTLSRNQSFSPSRINCFWTAPSITTQTPVSGYKLQFYKTAEFDDNSWANAVPYDTLYTLSNTYFFYFPYDQTRFFFIGYTLRSYNPAGESTNISSAFIYYS